MNKAKNKSKCDISFNDLPETDADMSVERSSCSANDAAAKYTALMTRLAPTVRKMRAANKKILKALKPLKAMVSKASAALSPLRGTLSGVDKAMKVLKKGLSPFKVFSTAVKKAMNKKICIKFKIKIGKIKKQSKKCSRPKNLVKTIKKYTQAAQKAFKVATQKIIDPIINRVKRKVMKIPGLSKMKSSLSKLASKMNINKKLNSVSKVLASVPGKTFVTQLRSATTQIKSLNTQMSR